jgi:proline iminopeptidase
VRLVTNGRPLFYETAGGGPSTPVMFMHGGMGLDHTYFRPWLEPFGRERTLIFYDHYGNGRSRELNPIHTKLTFDALCEDANAVRLQVTDAPIVVFGHSFGGCVAITYALRYPHAVRALILCNAIASVDFAGSMMAAIGTHGTNAQLEVYQRAFSGAVTNDDEFRNGWNIVVPLYFHRYKNEYGESINRATLYSAEGFNRFAAEAFPTYQPDLSAVNATTLVLGGRRDIIVAPEHGNLRLQREIRNSQLHMFDDSGHFPFIEENDRFVDIVSRWLSRIES